MNISQEKQVNNMRKLMMILMSLMLVACSTQTSAPEKEPEKKDEEKTKVSFIGVGDNLIHEMIYIQADKAAWT